MPTWRLDGGWQRTEGGRGPDVFGCEQRCGTQRGCCCSVVQHSTDTVYPPGKNTPVSVSVSVKSESHSLEQFVLMVSAVQQVSLQKQKSFCVLWSLWTLCKWNSEQHISSVRAGHVCCVYFISCGCRELILKSACVSVFLLGPLWSAVPCQRNTKGFLWGHSKSPESCGSGHADCS